MNVHLPTHDLTDRCSDYVAVLTLVMLGLGLALNAPRTCTAQEVNWIESWVFTGRSEDDVRKRLKEQVVLKVDQVDAACSLSEAQKRKLTLACKGDVDRFFRDIKSAREKTSGVKPQNANGIQEAWAEIRPLATRLQEGLFNEGSLFSKVLAQTLDDRQASEYSRTMREQMERRHRALVLDAVASLEEGLPLLQAERDRLVELALSQELKRFPGAMESFVGFAKLHKIPEADLKATLGEEQAAKFKQLLGRYDKILETLR